MEKVPKKKTVSVNFSHAVLSLLYFLILEDGTDNCPEMSVRNYYSMLCNISEECRSHDDLVKKYLVWLCMIPFRDIQFGVVWFSFSYANLRHHILKHQI